MSRPIRIAYPGAWYHVMNRGRRAENIYLDKLDHKAFVKLLQETSDTDKIISIVCACYDVVSKDLLISRRGTFNEPRCAAIYLLRRIRRDSLKDIGKRFNLEKPSSVSSVIERMKTRIQNSQKIKMRIQNIEEEVRKS